MNNAFVLPICYLPPLPYFSILANSDSTILDKNEYFVKQTYRNRCSIYGANGKLDLIIPLIHSKEKTPIQQKKICYTHNWKTIHWKSIESAYRSSPYFEFFETEFSCVFFEDTELLSEFNQKLIMYFIKALRLKVKLEFTTTFEKDYLNHIDLRNSFYPKDKRNQIHFKNDNKYQQVFSDKFGFISNLSIIDLVFNTGLKSIDILNSIQLF